MDLEVVGIWKAGNLHGHLLVLDDPCQDLEVTGDPIDLLNQKGCLVLSAESQCLFQHLSLLCCT